MHNMANFPNWVTYQRNANFGTHTLFDMNNKPVDVSIDPFFFKVLEALEGPKRSRSWL